MKNLALIVLLILTACKSATNKGASVTRHLTPIDASHYIVIANDLGGDIIPSVPLSDADIYKVDSLIKQAITKHNKTADQYEVIKSPKDYYKQLWAATNDKREKEVLVNCFCDTTDFPYWRKKKVLVIDGGNCFFGLELNLKTDSIYYLLVNNTAGVIHLK